MNFVNHYANGNPNIRYPGEVYNDWVQKGEFTSNFVVSIAIPHMPVISEDDLVIWSQAEEYILANMASAILARDRAAFESERKRIIDALIVMGLPAAQKPYFDGYPEAMTKALAEWNVTPAKPPSVGTDFDALIN